MSTYGKVIKRGWDWLGIAPRDRARITGLVEIPDLVSVLTTNKADFLQDGTSLAKYYRYRKAVQSEVDRLLSELGELEPPPAAPEKKIRPLERQLEQVIQEMLPDFPELAPLVGRRRGPAGGSLVADPAGSLAAVREAGEPAPDGGATGESGAEAAARSAEAASPIPLEPQPDGSEAALPGTARRKAARLTISFTEAPGRPQLGWLVESTLWVNRAHPAYRRAARRGWEPYHVIVTVAAVLAAHVEPGRPPQEFMSRFLSLWGVEG